MTPKEQADAIEACGRMLACGHPPPRRYYELAGRVIEARGGWIGDKPAGDVIRSPQGREWSPRAPICFRFDPRAQAGGEALGGA